MSAITRESGAGLPWRRWREPAAWATTADVFVMLTALTLPWSTTLVAIFAAGFVVAMVPFLDRGAFVQSLKRPICAAPIALFVLAVAGTLWSEAPWSERLHAVGPTAKLLMLPILIFHFERSARGIQVFTAFLVSCVLLMAFSWLVAYDPRLALKAGADYGVPVKNYIDQGQEFALCAVTLAFPVIMLLRARRNSLALALLAISLSFVVNMMFVRVSRTALVTMPLMLAIFALLHLKWRSVVGIIGAATILAGLAWAASPHLRSTTETFLTDYQLYREQNRATSIGLRLEFWRKSLRFVADAPILGHGTGSTRALFQEAAIDQSGAGAEVVANPHNQTLNVAIQWGAIGIVVLYAMWLAHLLLFRGDGLVAWIGLMVVMQNIFTSLFNSHIFDFNEGWIYVLGVGVAGGMLMAARPHAAAAATPNFAGP